MPDSTAPHRFDLSGLGLLDEIPPAEIVCGDLTLRVRPFESLTPQEIGLVTTRGAEFDRLNGQKLEEGQAAELAVGADALLDVLLVDPAIVPGHLGVMQRVGLVNAVMAVSQNVVQQGAEAKKKWTREHLSGSSTPASSPPAATPAPRSPTGSRRSRSRS